MRNKHKKEIPELWYMSYCDICLKEKGLEWAMIMAKFTDIKETEFCRHHGVSHKVITYRLDHEIN